MPTFIENDSSESLSPTASTTAEEKSEVSQQMERPKLSFLTPESLSSVKLTPQSPPPIAPPSYKPPVMKPSSLLEALQQGTSNLKKANIPPVAPIQATKAGAGNVLSMLADQMSKRRMYVKDNSDDESDSDDGFSSDED
jgi:hypothetical protein